MCNRIHLDQRKITPNRKIVNNNLSHPSLSHMEQECQKSFLQGKIHSHRDSKENFEY